MKNKEAPFAWMIRVNHPILLSRIMLIMAWKASSVLGRYIIDVISPVMICSVNVIPRRNPRFHRNEIDVGVGRSVRDFFIVLGIWFFLISCFFIRMKLTLFGMVGGRVR